MNRSDARQGWVPGLTTDWPPTTVWTSAAKAKETSTEVRAQMLVQFTVVPILCNQPSPTSPHHMVKLRAPYTLKFHANVFNCLSYITNLRRRYRLDLHVSPLARAIFVHLFRPSAITRSNNIINVDPTCAAVLPYVNT